MEDRDRGRKKGVTKDRVQVDTGRIAASKCKMGMTHRPTFD